jgi:NAD(P)H-dependent FMN reductase
MHLVALSGSLRAASTNTALVRAILGLLPTTDRGTLYDGLDDLPHFSPERDGDEPPTAVLRLRQLLATADSVLICTPEYAYGMPGSLKNALDWLVGSGELVGKPVAALSAGPGEDGGERAGASLVLTLTALSAQVVEAASFSVPFVRSKLGPAGTLTDLETEQRLRLAALRQAVAR